MNIQHPIILYYHVFKYSCLDEFIEQQLSEVTGTNDDNSEPAGSNDNSNSNSDQPNVDIGEVKR